jgi:magnesium transporter
MISRYLSQEARRKGLPPGAVLNLSDRRSRKTVIKYMSYGDDYFEEKTVDSIEECFSKMSENSSHYTWVNIDGLHDTSIITKLGEHYHIHPLTLEDILTIDQMAKIEEYDDYLFIIVRMVTFDKSEHIINSEQMSMFVMDRCLITLQETEGDVFDIIRERIRGNKGKIRKMGADYLAYSLIDAIVDGYFVVLDKIGEEIDEIEEHLISASKKTNTIMLMDIHELKRETIFLRRSIWPLREVLSVMNRMQSKFIGEGTLIYLKDSYDHTVQVIETVDSSREILSSMLDVYMSNLSNRMNEIMKVLTIISTIFIPLTFIAGIYGMNFHTDISPYNMPELTWVYGYPICLGSMLLVAIIMLIYFKRSKWI